MDIFIFIFLIVIGACFAIAGIKALSPHIPSPLPVVLYVAVCLAVAIACLSRAGVLH
jgi:hypothetical protein